MEGFVSKRVAALYFFRFLILRFNIYIFQAILTSHKLVFIGVTFFKRNVCTEVRNSWVTKYSYKTELHKMTSNFLTRKCFWKFFFRVTNSTSWNIKLNIELLTRRSNFYFYTFELLTRSWKTKSFTSSY